MEPGNDVADARKNDDTKGALKNDNPEPSGSPSGDHLDAKGLPWFKKEASPKIPVAPTSLYSPEYNMSHPYRGVALIFNHKSFNPRLSLNDRRGTDADRENLKNTARHLGFRDGDIHIFEDLTYVELDKQIKNYAEQDFRDKDCLFVCICTHGDQGILYAKDKKFRAEELWEPFTGDRCPSLAGKPKLFFVQACQGDRVDRGVPLDVTDSGTKCVKIPAYADFLIAYSTIPGFYSWRNTESGSWFMQALCEVLRHKSHQTDLLSMLTLVNYHVAYNFLSCVPTNPDMDKMKQIPCISSMLTRKLYFFKSQTEDDKKMDVS